MKIYLVRHAESSWQCSLSEDLDSELTEVGVQQADKLGRWLARGAGFDRSSRIEIARLSASPLKRAQQTADASGRALGLPTVTLSSLGEAQFHVAEHLPRSESPLRPSGPFRPSAQYAAFRDQARQALADLLDGGSGTGGAGLAVAHGGLLKTMLRQIAGSERVCFTLYNTGITLIEWRRGRWHIVFLNLLEHLPPNLRTL